MYIPVYTNTWIYTYTRTYPRSHTHIHITHTDTFLHALIYIHSDKYTHHIHIDIYMPRHAYIHSEYIDTNMHMHTHTPHTHTQAILSDGVSFSFQRSSADLLTNEKFRINICFMILLKERSLWHISLITDLHDLNKNWAYSCDVKMF